MRGNELHRRDAMIRVGQAGLGALALPGLLQAQKQSTTGTGGKAKSVILIYLWGGPPQMDMWDPNPEAPSGIRSRFKPIPTKAPGIHVSEAMPLFAKWTDKTAIIRSLTHDSNEHGNSVYYTLTGHKDKAKTFGRNKRSRKDWPGMGPVLSGLRPLEGMPGTVTIPRPIGHDGVTYSGTHAGFMGPRQDPLEIGRVAEEKGTDELNPLSLPKDVSKTRLLARKGLRQSLEELDRKLQGDPSTIDFTDYREQALGMLLPSAGGPEQPGLESAPAGALLGVAVTIASGRPRILSEAILPPRSRPRCCCRTVAAVVLAVTAKEGGPVALIVEKVVVEGGDLATRDVEPLALVLATARFARSRARRF